MFINLFSFEGRIRRTEYGVSIIIYTIVYILAAGVIGAIGSDEGGVVLILILIPLMWFIWSQGAKRCHDLGNSGWWQLIPFYGFWLLFQDGQVGPNQYGDNPKNPQFVSVKSQQSSQTYQNRQGVSSSYQGGYSGGHNNPNTNYDSTKTNIDQNTSEYKEGYKDGDLYN